MYSYCVIISHIVTFAKVLMRISSVRNRFHLSRLAPERVITLSWRTLMLAKLNANESCVKLKHIFLNNKSIFILATLSKFCAIDKIIAALECCCLSRQWLIYHVSNNGNDMKINRMLFNFVNINVVDCPDFVLFKTQQDLRSSMRSLNIRLQR